MHRIQTRLPRSTPESEGIPSRAIEEFLTAVEGVPDLHSFMLVRHGHVVAETWWQPYAADTPHMLYSLSKSFTSTAVGLAVTEGRLSVEDPVKKFFPDHLPPTLSANLAAMRIHHLLSMSTGHDEDTTDAVLRPGTEPYSAFLALPVDHEPGTHFVYNTAASFMLAAMVQRLTGQTVLDYLGPRLLEPLGIEGAVWASHPNGVNFGGFGLYVRTEDLARFGQLYLQQGSWNGRQILPAQWVELATSKQVDNGDDPESDWNQGYGYQFWRCRHDCYRADGAFGQFCIVMPQHDAVIAITAGVDDMGGVMNAIWDTLLPAMGPEPLPEDTQAARALREMMDSRSIAPPAGNETSTQEAKYDGKTYAFPRNEDRIQSMTFNFSDNSLSYRLQNDDSPKATYTLPFGRRSWVHGNSALGQGGPGRVGRVGPVASAGAWTGEDVFTLAICQLDTPHIITVACRFKDGTVEWRAAVNVGFGERERPPLTGTEDRG